jgi:hypothetical protein
MSWLNMLLPWQWAILGLLPVLLVALYFLKLRRQPLAVPSTYLWTKTLEDLHVNSLWQRLRQSLLLWLQLLMALLIILACLRPGCEGTELTGERFIFLIDQSASMSATDVGQGTRLDEAKRRISQMLDRMKPSDSAMLISFSNQAEVVQSYTRNKSQLKKKLESISQTERATDLTEALVAASGLANPGRTSTEETDIQVADSLPAKLMIYSDGGVTSVPDFYLGNLTLEYFPIGGLESPQNVGITAFAVSDESGADRKMQLFAQLRNSFDAERSVNLSLLVEGKLFDAKAVVKLAPGQSQGISFDLTALAASIREPQQLQLKIEEPDDYLQDNVIYGILNPPRPAQLLVVSAGNDYLRLALETEAISRQAEVRFVPRAYLETQEYLADASLGKYDLMIFDNCAPLQMPLCNTLFFGAAPPGDGWKFGEKKFPTLVANFDQTHPVMNALQLLRLTIVESAPIQPPAGSTVLLESADGPIMAVNSRDSFQDLVISFPLAELQESGELTMNTNWPSQLSFPLFIQNAVSYLAGGARYITSENVTPGSLVRLRLPASVEEVAVTTPEKRTEQIARGRDSGFSFSGTERTGWYQVKPVGSDVGNLPFAVNLLDVRESDLTVREKMEIGHEEVVGQTAIEPARTEFWRWLVAAALLVVIVEWVVYNRRVGM